MPYVILCMNHKMYRYYYIYSILPAFKVVSITKSVSVTGRIIRVIYDACEDFDFSYYISGSLYSIELLLEA